MDATVDAILEVAVEAAVANWDSNIDLMIRDTAFQKDITTIK